MSGRLTDAARLLAAARGGSTEALGEALESCRAYLLHVALSEMTAELQAKGGASDLVQEAFLDAQRDFGQFQGSSEEELLAWLRQVLLHKLANFRRHYRGTGKRDVAREAALPSGDTSGAGMGQVSADTPTPSKYAVANEKAQALEEALARLPEEYRQVILLRHDQTHSFEEIGRIMGRTANAARKLWTRALERLQQELGGEP
jgi:RNA polymerase sigma-70 factor (ECF subfamily)